MPDTPEQPPSIDIEFEDLLGRLVTITEHALADFQRAPAKGTYPHRDGGILISPFTPQGEMGGAARKLGDWITDKFHVITFIEESNNGVISQASHHTEEDKKTLAKSKIFIGDRPTDEDLVVGWQNNPEEDDLDFEETGKFYRTKDYISTENTNNMPIRLKQLIERVKNNYLPDNIKRERPESKAEDYGDFYYADMCKGILEVALFEKMGEGIPNQAPPAKD